MGTGIVKYESASSAVIEGTHPVAPLVRGGGTHAVGFQAVPLPLQRKLFCGSDTDEPTAIHFNVIRDVARVCMQCLKMSKEGV